MMTRREFLAQTAATSVATSILGVGNLVLGQTSADASNAESKRRAELETFLKIFPPSSPPESGRINAYDKTWEDWVKRTGALPPDFDSMPSIPGLPDPLLLTENGRQIAVTNEALWD